MQTLQKYQVDTNVLTVIQNHNGNHGKRVYRHLKQLGVTFIQFIPIVEPEKGKGVSERSVSPTQFGQFMVDVFEEWRKGDIGKVYVSHFDNALGMHLGMPSSICVHSLSVVRTSLSSTMVMCIAVTTLFIHNLKWATSTSEITLT
ncbi:hypothetical protein P4S64_12320 [Vibrio sp. M60_M31a]